MAVGRLLAIDQIIANDYFETPAPGGDQRQCFDSGRESLQQLFRQTDGAGRVVSHHAVFDADRVLIQETPPLRNAGVRMDGSPALEPATVIGRLLYANRPFGTSF